MMIDWVTVLVPFGHSEPINGGNVVSVSADGEIEWSVEKRVKVEGSYGSSIQIRSEHKDSPCSHIRLDGNPAKWLQGHNVWGSCDLHGLITFTLKKVLNQLAPHEDTSLLHHFVTVAHLTRVDLNQMYSLGSGKDVLTWLRAASESASISHRGRGQFSGDTLYWGKRSRRWSLKAYWKGGELKKHKPTNMIKDGFTPIELKAIQHYADQALRVELVLRSMELVKLGLSSVQSWSEQSFEEVYNSYLSKLEFSQNMTATKQPDYFEKLPARLVGPVQLWNEGHDLRTMYPRRTWYRYKKDIQNLIGLDISLPPPKDKPNSSNVVPLVRILEAVPMDVPSWAKGTDLYFEPPQYPKLQIVS